MKSLIKILEVSAAKHGADFPLTVGHLLNIARLAEKSRVKMRRKREEDEEREYRENLEAAMGSLGQG